MKLLIHFCGFCFFMTFPTVYGFKAKEAKSIMILKNYDQCEKDFDYDMKITDMKVARLEKDMYVLTAKTVIKEDIPGPLWSRIKIRKCQDNKGKEDTCIHFMDKEYSDLCKELENPKSVSYDFMNNTLNIPNPRCPIPKGTYPLKTKPIDAGDKSDEVGMIGKAWHIEAYYLKLDEFGNKVPACCVNFDALIEPKPKKEKNRSWGPVPIE